MRLFRLFSTILFNKKRNQSGFTLVEMLITIGIIGIITGILLIRYADFDSQIVLGNLAYDVALSVREAQALGISVRGNSGDFSIGYGAHFTIGNSYILFRDDNDDGDYDSGEEISTFYIGRANFIGDLCVNSQSDCDVDSLSVVYQRPESRAQIDADGFVGAVSTAEIIVESPKGNTRVVSISPTGQISVQ